MRCGAGEAAAVLLLVCLLVGAGVMVSVRSQATRTPCMHTSADTPHAPHPLPTHTRTCLCIRMAPRTHNINKHPRIPSRRMPAPAPSLPRPQMPMLEWLANNYKKFGCALEFVTNRSQEGSQFCKGFGGIGGVLRYSVSALWLCAVVL